MFHECRTNIHIKYPGRLLRYPPLVQYYRHLTRLLEILTVRLKDFLLIKHGSRLDTIQYMYL